MMLPRALLRTGLRDLLRRPLHTSLMIAGVALGVAVVIAVDLANESARRGFARSAEAVVGRATHRIEGGPSGVSEGLLAHLRRERGLRLSAPIVEGYAVTAGDERRPLRILGVDPLSEAPFRGGLGTQLVGEGGLPLLFTGAGAVLDGTTARALGLALGDRLRLRIDDRLEQVRVVGIAESEADGGAASELALMDVGQAQALLGRPGRLDRIDLILSAEEARALEDALPQGVRLAAASDQADTVGQLTDAFQLNLTALSLLALVVGMFLIYNTVMFRVVQRRRVIGTLRALGATPGQVFGMVVAETAVAAAVGAAIGLGLGWALGQGMVRLVTRTINDLYYVLAVTGAPLTATTALEGVVLGLGAGVASALAPAWEASRVQPVTAMRGSTLEESSRRWLPRVAGIGLLMLLTGGAVMALLTDSLVASFGALFLVALGIAATVPAGTVVLMRVVAGLARGSAGLTGRLAARTITRAVSRTGVAIAALMVAVSVTIGVSVMIESFRSTVVNWLDLTLRADVYVSAPGPGGRLRPPTLSPDVPERIAAVDGVAEVETFRAVRVASSLGEINLGATDARRARSAALYRFAEGDPEQMWRLVEEGAVVISEPFLNRHDLPERGAEIALVTDHGERRFPIVGVFYDFSTEEGTVLMSRAVYDRHWDDPGVTSVAAWAEPGVDAVELAERVRDALSGRAFAVAANRRLRSQALAVFDRTFAVTEALRLLAVIVAFIGVWSALMALQVERTRELATLRAVGMTPGQVGALTLVETGLMGLAAGLMSLPTGILLAVILTHVINLRSFGWSMRLELPPHVLAQAVVVSVAAALLAAIYPLRRIRGLPLAAALRQE